MSRFLGYFDCGSANDKTTAPDNPLAHGLVDRRYAQQLQAQIAASQRSTTPLKPQRLELSSARGRGDSRSTSPIPMTSIGVSEMIGSYHHGSQQRTISPFSVNNGSFQRPLPNISSYKEPNMGPRRSEDSEAFPRHGTISVGQGYSEQQHLNQLCLWKGAGVQRPFPAERRASEDQQGHQAAGSHQAQWQPWIQRLWRHEWPAVPHELNPA